MPGREVFLSGARLSCDDKVVYLDGVAMHDTTVSIVSGDTAAAFLFLQPASHENVKASNKR